MRTIATLAGAALLMLGAGGCAALSAPTADIGDCFDVGDDTTQVDQIDGFECSKEHDAEVYYKADVDFDGDYDEAKIDSAAQEMCLAGFSDYVGIDYYSSSLDIYYMYPLADGWESGDREVICSVYTPDYDTGDIVRTSGSLKDSKQ